MTMPPLIALRNGDPTIQLLLTVGGITAGVGALIIFVLARSSKLRELFVWALVQFIDPDRWNDVSWWDVFRRSAANRIRDSFETPKPHTRLKPPAPIAVQEPPPSPMPQPLSNRRVPRSYTTTVRASDNAIVKQANTCDGLRVLRKEIAVIRSLRNAANGSAYEHYFPHCIQDRLENVGDTAAFQASPKQTFNATQIRQQYPDGVSGRHVAWMFNRTLEIVGFAHQQGTVHAAVMPQHLLFDCKSHALMLVDWTHAKRIGASVTFVPHRYQCWYPETPFATAEPSLDIYMAAKSALYLAGVVDCQSCVVRRSSRQRLVPSSIIRFLKSCVIESPRMRPSDAWQLHEEFGELLETIYGEPTFCALAMNQTYERSR